MEFLKRLSHLLSPRGKQAGKQSAFAEAVDYIQGELTPLLKARGFRVRGRSFNKLTEDGLTQVVSLQMGPSDPPGTTYIPGLRENLYGLFTINLGVYVPEVARHTSGGSGTSWIQEYDCCVRSRLGEASGETKDIWWHARSERAIVDGIWRRLESGGLPFLDRYSSRDNILAEWKGRAGNSGGGNPPRIVMAIILAERGNKKEARELLALQAQDTHNPRHPDYVRELAKKLGLGSLRG